jgi:Tfp pilus assembly protein PilF
MGKVSGIRTTGRNAAYRYKKQSSLNFLAVERELGARLLETGTIRRREGRLTVSAPLDDSMSRGELWAETYEGDAGDVGVVSNDMARDIADALRNRFGDAVGVRSATSVGTTSATALDLYLVGSALVKRRGAGIAQSAAYFGRAIAADSGFARAHAALAMTLEYYPYFLGTLPEEVRARVVTAAQRAIALDPTLAEPHMALGWANAHAGDSDAATVEFERALALAPDNVDAHFQYGRFLMRGGRAAEALVQFRLARRGERVSSLLSAWIGHAHFTLGHADSAEAESALAVQLDSTLLPTANLGALMHLARGKRELARRLMAVVPPPGVMTDAPYVYAMLGDTATARRLLSAMAAHRPVPWFTEAAHASVMLAKGDTSGALTALERSESRSGSMWVGYLPITDQVYDPVRGSARFVALARRAGVDERALVRQRRAAH